MSSYVTKLHCYKNLKILSVQLCAFDNLTRSSEHAEWRQALISRNRVRPGDAVFTVSDEPNVYILFGVSTVFRHVGQTVACDLEGKAQPLRSVCLYVWLSRQCADLATADVLKCAERNSVFIWLSFTWPFCVIVFSPCFGLLTVTRARTVLPVTLKWVWPANANVRGSFYPCKKRRTSGLPG